MPSISVGQADNLLSGGSVAMPKYINGSLTHKQYPCGQNDVDLTTRPVPIPLGSFDPKDPFIRHKGAIPTLPIGAHSSEMQDMMLYDMPKITSENILKEEYVADTQHKNAGEFSDLTILLISVTLLFFLIGCTYLSFKLK